MKRVKNVIKVPKLSTHKKNTRFSSDSDFFRGIKQGLGFTFIILIFLTIAYAGSHYASNILGGTFLGNYTFNGSVNFEISPQVKQRYYYLPKSDQFVVNLSTSNCVDNGDNYKCAYEPDNDGDGCPDDMARVGDVCVDKWEASYDCFIYKSQSTQGSSGPITTDGDADRDDYLWQTRNIATINGGPAVCKGVSRNNSIPYTTITQYDAKQSCLLSGKSLISNGDWQKAAFGTPDDATKCKIDSTSTGTLIPSADWYNQGGDDAVYTGSASECVSDYGIYDMIGGVWEWTDDLIDAVSNDDFANSGTYGNDYLYRNYIGNIFAREGSVNASISVIIRSGDWSVGSRAGLFSLYIGSSPSGWYWSDGFRCSMNPSN